MKPRLSLVQVFFLVLVGLSLILAGFFAVLFRSSKESILTSSAQLRNAAALRVGQIVTENLEKPERGVENLERDLRMGICSAATPDELEPCLTSAILRDASLAEVAFTHADVEGYEENGDVRLGPAGRWQLSIGRDAEGLERPLCARTTRQSSDGFVASTRCHPPEELAADPKHPAAMEPAHDPTESFAFLTPAGRRHQHQTLRTDLSYSELDAMIPPEKRRVVTAVLRPLEDSQGHFLGVLRVSLSHQYLNDLEHFRVDDSDEHDPHHVFICDEQGRLLTRLSPEDHLEVDGDDLRIAPASLPPEVSAALHQETLGDLDQDTPFESVAYSVRGQTYDATFGLLPGTQDWRVGIVGPENYYLRDLRSARRQWLMAAVGSLLLTLVGGGVAFRALRRGLKRVENAALRMRHFDFATAPSDSGFTDVQNVLEGLEQSKTAMRALAKYVPVPLVRRLFEANREPTLGGVSMEISLMFTDIKDFTSIAETLAPDVLARLLGRYLEVMTAAIHGTEGIVDKYIGDAVMVLWNATSPCADHAVKACRGALACLEAGQQLFASSEWRDLPPFVTRYGLHRDEVLVGHFGAPDRMSFTALGDGVNLASRLEGLNKFYGTTILASDSIRERAEHLFHFRQLDRVAVKGKSQGVAVYELLGSRIAEPRPVFIERYEQALRAYFDRRFDEAITLLDQQLDDAPSVVLANRCRELRAQPPPSDWNGVFVASSK